jgi:hypothetical protein
MLQHEKDNLSLNYVKGKIDLHIKNLKGRKEKKKGGVARTYFHLHLHCRISTASMEKRNQKELLE